MMNRLMHRTVTRLVCRMKPCYRHSCSFDYSSAVQFNKPTIWMFRPLYKTNTLKWSQPLLPHHNFSNVLSRNCHAESSMYWLMKIASSTPVLWAQEQLENFHDLLGLPWWATIVITTFGLRTCLTLPLTIYQNHILARYENLQPEIAKLAKELQQETAIATKMYNWSKLEARIAYRRSLKKIVTKLIIRDNCHPFKSTVVIWIQLPAWISLSFALRNMAYMLPQRSVDAEIVFLQLTVGGTLWFPNLTIPDASLIIPVLLGIVNLMIVELHALRLKTTPSKLQKIATNITRVLSVVMVPVAMTMPVCVPLYWLCSSCYGLGQNILLLTPRVRRFFRIPQTPSESKTPFRDVIANLKHKLSRRSPSS